MFNQYICELGLMSFLFFSCNNTKITKQSREIVKVKPFSITKSTQRQKTMQGQQIVPMMVLIKKKESQEEPIRLRDYAVATRTFAKQTWGIDYDEQRKCWFENKSTKEQNLPEQDCELKTSITPLPPLTNPSPQILILPEQDCELKTSITPLPPLTKSPLTPIKQIKAFYFPNVCNRIPRIKPRV